MPTSALVVSTDLRTLDRYRNALAGFIERVTGVRSLKDAKAQLAQEPIDVVVTDAHLGAFNGLHLALWCSVRMFETRVVIVGAPDPVLHADTVLAGAWYIAEGNVQHLVSAVRQALARANKPTRRLPRQRLATEVPVLIGKSPARLIDVGYGGFCVHRPGRLNEAVVGRFVMEIPQYDFRAAARWVWVKPIGSWGYRCGATLQGVDEGSDSRWRSLVETIAGHEASG
jgi:hypothetical protein